MSATDPIRERLADAAVPVGWGTWLFTNITHINELLEMVLLSLSIVATMVAIRYHWRRTPK